MRHLVVVAAALLAAGCSEAPLPETTPDPDSDIRACETYIRGTIEAPQRYRRLSVARVDRPVDADDLARAMGASAETGAERVMVDVWAEKGLKLRDLRIDGMIDDAQGNSVRRSDICRFALSGDQLVSVLDLDQMAAQAVLDYERRQFARQGIAPGVPADPEPDFPCCLR